MPNHDVLFKTEKAIFSYRVAGVLVRAGKVLLQRPIQQADYAFPGGHVGLSEASQEALAREFKEETGADILPARLLWVGENFFPWGERTCHQICFYYLVSLRDESQIPLEGCFVGRDELDGSSTDLAFCWVPLAELGGVTLYPLGAREKLLNLSDQIETFVFIE